MTLAWIEIPIFLASGSVPCWRLLSITCPRLPGCVYTGWCFQRRGSKMEVDSSRCSISMMDIASIWGNLSNGHPLASTVLLAAFALLIFIDLAKKGTLNEVRAFFEQPSSLPSTLVFGNSCKFRKRNPTLNLLLNNCGWKACFFSTKKNLARFYQEASNLKQNPHHLHVSVRPLRILVLFASLSLGAFLAIEVKTQVAVLLLGWAAETPFGSHEL